MLAEKDKNALLESLGLERLKFLVNSSDDNMSQNHQRERLSKIDEDFYLWRRIFAAKFLLPLSLFSLMMSIISMVQGKG